MFAKALFRMTPWIRTCPCCHGIAPPIRFFCNSCWIELLNVRNQSRLYRIGYPFSVYSLFTWTEKNDHFIRPLIYGLKGGGFSEVLKELAESFSWERSQTQMPQQRSFFTPPPRKKNKLDHAGEFASALSQIWGAQVKDLRRTQLRPTQQKKRSLKERKELRFLQESVSSDQTAIFVDDVITSGATAQAAFEALGRPRDYEVWTVACRPKLAGLQGL